MDRYCVKPGSTVRLKEWKPDDASGFKGDKEAAADHLERLCAKLAELQAILYAEHKHKLLIVLQGMDTSGKDGVVRHVFRGVNPQGVRVVSFKKPTDIELGHDFLWRVHQHLPGKGEIVVFNRSHYEDVLIVRVLGLAPESVWSKRYRAIRDFEQVLAQEGTTILKFFLHVSQEEQKKRLQDRLDTPEKLWKVNPQDFSLRKRWPDFMEAYEDAMTETSTPFAPWYVVPANRKWYRNLVISTAIVKKLESLRMCYPKPAFNPDEVRLD